MPDPADKQILTMPAGPELDALVFERVMGKAFPGVQGLAPDDHPRPYSTEERYAQRVGLRLVRVLGVTFWHRFPRAFPVLMEFRTKQGKSVFASGETKALAICRGALLALRALEDEQGETPDETHDAPGEPPDAPEKEPG